MERWVVTAIGADRVGIVAAVTGALARHRCNLADTTMTRLAGCFAMMLLVTAPDDVGEVDLVAALAPVGEALGLRVEVFPAPDDAPPEPEDASGWVLSVHGADRPGIVSAVTAVLAERGVSVQDLSSHVVGSPALYVVALDLDLPSSLDVEELRAALAATAGELGVGWSLTAAAADVL